MKQDTTFLALAIGAVLLVLMLGSLLYLGTFNVGERTSSGQYEGAGPGLQTQPGYHVFNFFNTAALTVLLFLSSVITLVIISKLSSKTASLLASLLYIVGTLLIFASATIFLFGLHDLLTFSGPGETYVKPTVMQQYGWIIESIVFGLLGYAFAWAGEQVRRRAGETGSLLYLSITPVASLLVLFTIPVFIVGVNSVFNPGYTGTDYMWLLETILFGGLAAFAFAKIDQMRFANGETGSWKPYPLYAAGYALLLPAFFFFIWEVTLLLYDSMASSAEAGRAFLEIAIYAAFGFGSFYLIDIVNRNEKGRSPALPDALAPVGFLFLLAATFAFIGGFGAWLRADVTAQTYRSSFAWLVQTLLFGLLGFGALTLSDRILGRAAKVKKGLPRALSLCGIIFAITSLLYCFSAVENYFGVPAPDLNLFVEFAVYSVIALASIRHADRMRDARLMKEKRLLPTALTLWGGFVLLAALTVFVFGIHEFLYSVEPNLNWLMKCLAYGILGAISLGIGNWMKPILR